MQTEKKSIIELALKYKQVPITLTVFMCLAGIYATFTMPRQEFPEFKVRQGLVIAALPGASSRQVDEQLAKPLQNYLFGFKEVDRSKTYSLSKEGQTVTFLEVNPNIKEPEIFWSKLRLGLNDFKAQLPPQVAVLVGNNDFGDASAVLLTITSKTRSYRELEYYLEKLEDKFRANPAVSKVKHFGLQKEQITIYADPARLAHYGVKTPMLISALQLEGMLGYGGSVKGPDLELPIHLPPRFNSEADVAEQIVYAAPNGAIVRVKDVARVVREYDVENSYIEADGNRALVLSMEMRFGHNIVKFGKEVDSILADFKRDNPADIEITKVADMPGVVSTSITHFFRDFGMAILSVILVTVLLLPRRVATVAAITIPICVFQTMGILELFGVELNTVSLAMLVVVLGMIVDNAIVVIDNHVEKLDHGIDVREAAWTSAQELAVPVFTATLAIICAFLPMPFFMTGMAKDFLGPMPVTVAAALTVSMAVAMLLVPILSFTFIKTGLHPEGKVKTGPSLLDRLQAFYNAHLEKSMQNPKRSVALGAAAILAGGMIFLLIPQQTFPTLERNQFALEIYFPEGTALEKNAVTTRKIAAILRGDGRIKDVTSFIGTSSPRFHTLYAPQIPAKNYSQLIVNTKSYKDTIAVLKEYDPKYRDAFPGAHLRWKELSFLSAEAPIEVRISGDSVGEVKAFAEEVRKTMVSDKDITWLRDDYRGTLLSADLDLDREAANRLGITRGLLGASAAMNRGGLPVSTIWEGDYPREVVMKYDREKSSAPEKLEDQYVSGLLTPRPVLLRQVAKLRPGFSEGQIVRRNGRITLTMRADVTIGKLAAPVFGRITKKIEALAKPPSIEINYGGEQEQRIETFTPMVKSLLASIVLIFLILLFQFRNVRLAILIMATMPLSIIGGVLGLALIGYPFGLTAFVGFIGLFGMTIRNGIILISYAHELEAKGLSVSEAATKAGERRLRPIFLTASAAAVGVIPLITSGSSLWGPLGTVICFGLIGATILTLLVLPAAYALYGEKQEAAK